MIKDLSQKQKAVRFCVATGIVPYMEVVVRYQADITDVQSDISDVDVLGIRPSGLQGQKSVIFDCKTQNKVSAINRALWAAGLMQLIGAAEGYVILNKAAPEGHRLAANKLGVRLTSERLFDEFGKNASANYFEGLTYLDSLTALEWIYGIERTNSSLSEIVVFVMNEAPLQKNPSAGFRALIAKLKRAEGEFDSSKPPHVALWGLILCEAVRFFAEICIEFQNVFDPIMDKGKFEALLRNYVWGGKEAYNVRQKLHYAIKSGRNDPETLSFDLPGWPRFIEMIRTFLDAPHLISSGVLPLKDLAFRGLCDASPKADERIKAELSANSRARQFLLVANKYLGSLSPHLKDCSDFYNRTLTSI